MRREEVVNLLFATQSPTEATELKEERGSHLGV